MPKIRLLPKEVAELIAAGEVVERPSSVIKELVENSIDAGADTVTVEIQRGGITYIRVTDNGCGIAHEDVPTAFLRHATSKIKAGTDLDAIATLGFRGEALAAVSSVARVDMLTAVKGAECGTHYRIEGGEECLYEETGSPEGTTIVIKDIFYNTPARMKFLKKDVSEANSCAAVIDRIALSHPEISFKFIRDGKQTLTTPGDGKLKNAVYSVLGREFSGTLTEVSGDGVGGINVTGLTCKPVYCKPTRNYQFTFLNGRLVRSGTVAAAVEQAYKNSAMVGKFPGFVLYISVPCETVDVNVHPAKTEVRFSDEKRIFDSVYAAVKKALTLGDTRPEIRLEKPAFNRFEHMTAAEYRQQKITDTETPAEKIYKVPPVSRSESTKPTRLRSEQSVPFAYKTSYVGANGEKTEPMTEAQAARHFDVSISVEPEKGSASAVRPRTPPEKTADINPTEAYEASSEKPEITVIGEAFSTYIIVQSGDSVFMIDKHAAHERLLFNELKKNRKMQVQALLTPTAVTLSKEEYGAVTENTDLLLENGFEVEDFGNSSVMVRAVPSCLSGEDIAALISEIAEKLLNFSDTETEKEESIYHSVACKAAIKAGQHTEREEMRRLAERVLGSREVMYCPHGRPVAFEIKKRELEKRFGRIQ